MARSPTKTRRAKKASGRRRESKPASKAATKDASKRAAMATIEPARPRGSSATAAKQEIARLSRELSDVLAQQAATSEVLQVISSSTGDVEPVFSKLLEKATRVCGAQFGAMGLFDGETYQRVAIYNVPPAFDTAAPREFRPGPDGPIGIVQRTGRIVRVDDLRLHPNYVARHPAMVAMVEVAGARTLVVVPMLKDRQTIGAISIYHKEVRPFRDSQINLLKNFASQAVIAIENTRLFNQTNEALARQTATSEVLQVISSSPGDLKPVFEAMLARAMRLCEAQCGFIYQGEEGATRAVAEIGVPQAFAEYRRQHLHTGGAATPIDVMRATRKPAHVHDARNSEPYRSGNPNAVAGVDLGGARTVLYVPMIRNDDIVGVINLYRQEVKPFTDEQIALLENFASQAVIAIENARLFNETREALARQTATADVLKVIASSPSNLQPVFDAIAGRSNELVGGHSTTVGRYVDGMVQLASFTPVNPEADATLRAMFPHSPNSGDPQIAQVLRGEVARIAEAATEILDSAMRETARARGWRSRLIVPLKGDVAVIGWISVTRKEPGEFADKDVELLRTFADQAVIAVSNVELFRQVQARTRDLQESLEQQTATAEILSSISGSMNDTKPVFDAIVRNLRRLFDTRFAVVQTLDEGIVEMPAVDGEAGFERLRERYPRPLARDTVGGIAMLEKRTLQYHPVLGNPAAPATTQQFARDFGFDSVLFNPMLSGDKVVGAIGVARHEAIPFDDKQIALIASFANQAVIAIENTRLLRELRERTDALTRSLDDLRAAQDRLVQTEKLASLGQLTAGIAHEIKNPLNFVNNFSALSVELTDELNDVLRQAELAEKPQQEVNDLTQLLKSNLEKIVQHGKRADSIVKNMLLHSREGSGEQRAADINALVEESLNLAYHGARAEQSGFNITLQRAFDGGAGSAELYPQEMTRALLNLISNGFYAASKRKAENGEAAVEPTLLASTKDLGHSVEIRIRDNGSGIPPEVKEKMFNPFFTTKPAGEGTGLGLSMTHDIIVKQHGGTIDVATEPGNFTEFIVVLPRANGGQKSRGPA
jgi:GAF domain-containing protein